jgi:hypothetical protein
MPLTFTLDLTATPRIKTGFLPQSSPTLVGEIREREQAVKFFLSTAC